MGRILESVGFDSGVTQRKTVEVMDGESGDDGKVELTCVTLG